jgi:hypothetical protein
LKADHKAVVDNLSQSYEKKIEVLKQEMTMEKRKLLEDL